MRPPLVADVFKFSRGFGSKHNAMRVQGLVCICLDTHAAIDRQSREPVSIEAIVTTSIFAGFHSHFNGLLISCGEFANDDSSQTAIGFSKSI